MGNGDLGRLYQDNDILCREGENGDHMFVIQQGAVEVVTSNGGSETSLAVLKEGSIIGEIAIFEKVPRSATVRAVGEVRALTVDRKNLLRRVSEDPTLALRVIRSLSGRVRDLTAKVRDLNDELSQLR
jgi:CRP-like cAMP-binding protein